MSLLEDRYRRVLRLLPAAYRAGREEEMVAAFLEGSAGVGDEHNAWPRWREAASVAALAVRVRLGGPGATPRSIALGEAARMVAALGLAYWAVQGCALTVGSLVNEMIVDAWPRSGDAGWPQWPWRLLLDVCPLLWAAALAALVLARRRAAKALATTAFCVHVAAGTVAFAVSPASSGDLLPAAFPTWLPGLVTVLTVYAGFHRDAPPVGRPSRGAVIALASGFALALVPQALVWAALTGVVSPETWSWAWALLDDPGLAALGLPATALWCLGERRGSSAALAPAILGLSFLPAGAAVLNLSAVDPASHVMNAVTAAQLAMILVCGGALAVWGTRTLPPAAPSYLARERPLEG
ncbi:hypothetical protein [Microbispora sp. NPDC049125]|uniref:hypothetical protein n=1 Tax=Microbispora sp. NPDC049125 TaxID=3154929 RepID=UPI003467D86E